MSLPHTGVLKLVATVLAVIGLAAASVPAGAHDGDPDDGKSKSTIISKELSSST